MKRNDMSAKIRITTLSALGLFSLCALSPAALAEIVDVQGTASVPYSGSVFSSKVDSAVRENVLQLAEIDALNRYSAGLSAAKFQLYQRAEAEIKAHLASYVSQPVVLEEGFKKEEKSYYVVVRVSVNTNQIDDIISHSASGNSNAAAPQAKTAISFLFVARTTSAVKQFDTRKTQVNVSSERVSGKQSGSLSGKNASLTSTANRESTVTTGGNSVRQADVVTYAVSSPEDMNATMSQIFSANSIDVYDYRDISAQCGGTKPETAYAAFSNTDILSGELRKGVFGAAKKCGVTIFATGTLDVGMQDTDPVSGMARVYVSVRTQVNDVSGVLPRTIASVGPVQYSGLGPDAQVAQRNALTLAAKEVAQEISSQLLARNK